MPEIYPVNGEDNFLPYQRSIINEMFLYTADENYIIARWSHDNQLITDFLWNSAHCLEKYMKAVLLFNGKSVKAFGHELTALYSEVEKIGGFLLPTVLQQPPMLDIYHWIDTTPRVLMEHLAKDGNPDNRYLTYGYAHHSWHLHMVDSIVWSIRRLALPLDLPVASSDPTAPTHRALLINQPDFANRLHGALEQVIEGQDCEKRRALLNNNCAFAPAAFRQEMRRSTSSARNPVLLRRIIQPLSSSRRDVAIHGYRMAVWLLANTRQSSALSTEIKEVMRTALAKHPGIDRHDS